MVTGRSTVGSVSVLGTDGHVFESRRSELCFHDEIGILDRLKIYLPYGSAGSTPAGSIISYLRSSFKIYALSKKCHKDIWAKDGT